MGIITRKHDPAQNKVAKEDTETATFAAGCFWGVQLSFQRVPGVVTSMVGYTAGSTQHPTYRDVCSGSTGHTEAVQMLFNPAVVSYKELLTVLFDRMDPTTLNRQGNDRGTQYRSGIYYHSEEQKEIALNFIKEIQPKYKDRIVVEVKGQRKAAWIPSSAMVNKMLTRDDDADVTILCTVTMIFIILSHFKLNVACDSKLYFIGFSS